MLARLGYGHKSWVLPGGGMERGETHLETAIRETKEESGIDIINPVYLGERSYNNQYKKITVFYFTAQAATMDLIIDGQEIVDAGWFSLDSLPKEITPRLHEEIAMYNDWKVDTLIYQETK